MEERQRSWRTMQILPDCQKGPMFQCQDLWVYQRPDLQWDQISSPGCHLQAALPNQPGRQTVSGGVCWLLSTIPTYPCSFPSLQLSGSRSVCATTRVWTWIVCVETWPHVGSCILYQEMSRRLPNSMIRLSVPFWISMPLRKQKLSQSNLMLCGSTTISTRSGGSGDSLREGGTGVGHNAGWQHTEIKKDGKTFSMILERNHTACSL